MGNAELAHERPNDANFIGGLTDGLAILHGQYHGVSLQSLWNCSAHFGRCNLAAWISRTSRNVIERQHRRSA